MHNPEIVLGKLTKTEGQNFSKMPVPYRKGLAFCSKPSTFQAVRYFILVFSPPSGMRMRSSNQPPEALTVAEPPYFSAVRQMLFRP